MYRSSAMFALPILTLLTITSPPAMADAPKDNAVQYERRGDTGLSVDLSIGVMNGEANEVVYNPNGSVLSHLIWTFDNVVVLNGNLNYKWNWLNFGVKGRVNITDDSTMDDFDFPGAICGISGPFCQSHHENTSVERALMLDLYAGAELLRVGQFGLQGVIGYKWEHNSWSARGGVSNYTLPFPNIPVISYEQWWEAPYFGLQASGEWDSVVVQCACHRFILGKGTRRRQSSLADAALCGKFRQKQRYDRCQSSGRLQINANREPDRRLRLRKVLPGKGHDCAARLPSRRGCFYSPGFSRSKQ